MLVFTLPTGCATDDLQRVCGFRAGSVSPEGLWWHGGPFPSQCPWLYAIPEGLRDESAVWNPAVFPLWIGAYTWHWQPGITHSGILSLRKCLAFRGLQAFVFACGGAQPVALRQSSWKVDLRDMLRQRQWDLGYLGGCQFAGGRA